MLSLVPRIRVSDTDHRRLSEIVEHLSSAEDVDLDGLTEELDRAEIVPASRMPRDVVAMNSTVVYEDLDTGKTMMLQLTYPEDANVEHGRISVLAPVGAALLGLGVGETISWPLPDGRVGRLRVKQLIQPPRQRRKRATSVPRNSPRAPRRRDSRYAAGLP